MNNYQIIAKKGDENFVNVIKNKTMNAWYNTLNKPVFTPPSEVFTIVWPILYVLIFTSFIIMLNKNTINSKVSAIALFVAQLILNFSWSPVFFYFYNIEVSFYIILLLLLMIFLTILAFYKISKLAAILLIPYFLWVCFATVLNYNFMILNP